MLAYQIFNYYEYIDQELKKMEEILEPIFIWSNKYEQFITVSLTKILKSETVSQGGIHYIVKEGKIKEDYNVMIKNLKSSFLPYKIFKPFGEFKQKVITYKDKNRIKNDYIEVLISEMEDVFDSYDKFQEDDKEQERLLNLANKLISLKASFFNAKLMYNDFKNLHTDIEKLDSENQESLEIQLLDAEYSVNEFSNNLKNMDDIYNEIGNLIFSNSVSIEYEKLSIIKIESGSMLSRVFGNKNIIEIFCILLKKAVNWIQTKYELGEEIQTHRKLAVALKEDVELMGLLEKNGCNVEKSKQLIEKSFNKIAKEISEIVEKSANIKVNDEEFKIKESMYNKYLKEASIKQISSENK